MIIYLSVHLPTSRSFVLQTPMYLNVLLFRFSVQLYDVMKDPSETTNIASQKPKVNNIIFLYHIHNFPIKVFLKPTTFVTNSLTSITQWPILQDVFLTCPIQYFFRCIGLHLDTGCSLNIVVSFLIL